MPVFISYSHEDSGFVDELASHLVNAKAQVWVDRWELRVGESLVSRIEKAIQSAGALLVVLSNASVQSEWCRKELTAGLMRELEEKRVVVLPVLLEDCDVPLFLRDKLYADFRSNFDVGLRAVLESVARVTNETRGRLDAPTWHTDWAQDWYEGEGHFVVRLTLVEHAVEQPYTVLTEVRINANAAATARYNQFVEAGVEWFGRQMIMESLGDVPDLENLTIILQDQFPVVVTLGYRDTNSEIGYDISVRSRLLGEDTGRDVALHLGRQLLQIVESSRTRTRDPSREELEQIMRLVGGRSVTSGSE